ncbi:hypothetical protein BC629DRAFT_1592999 [Irpex lacteus]|nr:hypothetical protein BC629DRAFT_1592999 [Irpex lacteus]
MPPPSARKKKSGSSVPTTGNQGHLGAKSSGRANKSRTRLPVDAPDPAMESAATPVPAQHEEAHARRMTRSSTRKGATADLLASPMPDKPKRTDTSRTRISDVPTSSGCASGERGTKAGSEVAEEHVPDNENSNSDTNEDGGNDKNSVSKNSDDNDNSHKVERVDGDNDNEEADSDSDMYTDEEPVGNQRITVFSPTPSDDYLPSPVMNAAQEEGHGDNDGLSGGNPESDTRDDAESHSSIEYTGKGKNKATRSIPPVTFSDHKFKHPGTTHARQGKQKKRDDRTPSPAPVEDSPPVTPSPRKRAKTGPLDNHNDTAGISNPSDPVTPVSRITAKMNTSVLATPTKATVSSSSAPAHASASQGGAGRGRTATSTSPASRAEVMQDMVDALNLGTDMRNHLCPSLQETYTNLPLLSRPVIQHTCLSRIAVNKLRVYLGFCHIPKDSELERAIVSIVTTPWFGPLVYNPARADWRDLVLHTPVGGNPFTSRPYVAHVDALHERTCAIVFGGVHKCRVVHEHELGNSGNMAKTAPISPLCIEWPRAFNTCSHVFDFTYMHVPAWDGSIGFITRTKKKADNGSSDRWSTNPFLDTSPKTASTTQGVQSVDYHTVSGDKTEELNRKLRDILANNGLACDDDVPVYNLTQHYGAGASVSGIQTPDMFLARMAAAPLWQGEIPDTSFVGVLGIPNIYDRHRMNDGSVHSDLRFTLVAVCVLATPFMQGSL